MSQPPNGGRSDDRPPGERPPGGPAPYGAPYPPGAGPYPPQMPSGQMPSGQMQPGQMQPGPYQPGAYPPGQFPPGQFPSPYTPLEGGRSDRTMRWIGLIVGFFAGPTILVTLWSLVSFLMDAIGYREGLTGVSIAAGVLFLAAMVAGLVFPQTRWWALGMIIGIAVSFIVLAGACLAFIFLLTAALES